jgi:polyisoprenyl-phosphate glycosyltransferase
MHENLEERMGLQPDDAPRYSIVVPIHNEIGALPELAERLEAVMNALDGPTEVILVDDGSVDGTYGILQSISERDRRFKVIRLSRQFGQQAALTAGIDFSRGEAVIMMDGDLQHPPELIPELAEKWREGFDVVHAVRESSYSASWLRRTSSRVFYRVIAKISDVEMRANVADFRLIDRRVTDIFSKLDERSRYVRGLFNWIGLRQGYVGYNPSHRETGTSKYGIREMGALARSAITGFSTKPLRLALYLGIGIGALAFACGLAALGARLAGVFTAPGWTSLMLFVAFSSGAQLFVLGVIGMYLSELSTESKSRPLYIVEDLHAMDDIPPGHVYRRGVVVGPALRRRSFAARERDALQAPSARAGHW